MMNQILVKRVRCRLSKDKLPKHYKGVTLYTTMHILNLIPTVALNIKVIDKIWFGNNVNYDHLKYFGCKDFVHLLKDKRFKLDAKSKRCIFIGYGQNEFSYILHDPISKTILRSHDVVFIWPK